MHAACTMSADARPKAAAVVAAANAACAAFPAGTCHAACAAPPMPSPSTARQRPSPPPHPPPSPAAPAPPSPAAPAPLSQLPAPSPPWHRPGMPGMPAAAGAGAPTAAGRPSTWAGAQRSSTRGAGSAYTTGFPASASQPRPPAAGCGAAWRACSGASIDRVRVASSHKQGLAPAAVRLGAVPGALPCGPRTRALADALPMTSAQAAALAAAAAAPQGVRVTCEHPHPAFKKTHSAWRPAFRRALWRCPQRACCTDSSMCAPRSRACPIPWGWLGSGLHGARGRQYAGGALGASPAGRRTAPGAPCSGAGQAGPRPPRTQAPRAAAPISTYGAGRWRGAPAQGSTAPAASGWRPAPAPPGPLRQTRARARRTLNPAPAIERAPPPPGPPAHTDRQTRRPGAPAAAAQGRTECPCMQACNTSSTAVRGRRQRADNGAKFAIVASLSSQQNMDTTSSVPPHPRTAGRAWDCPLSEHSASKRPLIARCPGRGS